ncbi:uncharacterized protein VTP21DRAFT_6038 [Calcarisporiella thermophila]|uniref:uncharacterized protein n=1 Tax=Calcarisporiella thermophila TaxID=911321 RepID=UPI003743E403
MDDPAADTLTRQSLDTPRSSFDVTSADDVIIPSSTAADHDALLSLLVQRGLTLSSSPSEDTELHGYLNRLTSLSLEALKAEPLHLSEKMEDIQSNLTRLALDEHKAFIEAYDARVETAHALEQMNSHVQGVIKDIPLLEEQLSIFSKGVESIVRERRRLSLVLESHSALLDILEIPQLMDTCVRNGYYAEAMDLHAHTQRLTLRYPGPVVARVAEQVANSCTRMMAQLVTLLQEPIKLPTCIRVVGYLRRMDVFAEDELRLLFLKSRDSYLSEALSKLNPEKRDPARYVKKYVDTFREIFFDTLAQFRSLFAAAEGGWVLSDYVTRGVSELDRILREWVPLIKERGALASLHTQLVYCAVSLGRVGVDFRWLVEEIFEEAVERLED